VGIDVISMFDVLSGAIWTMLIVALPILLVAMVVGLVIGILQTATSLQEQTLFFIPKILAVFVFIVLVGPWMAEKVLIMTREILGQLERFIQ
jgi:flagellar biosynthetic protein FliQ